MTYMNDMDLFRANDLQQKQQLSLSKDPGPMYQRHPILIDSINTCNTANTHARRHTQTHSLKAAKVHLCVSYWAGQ